MENQNNLNNFLTIFLDKNIGNDFDWIKCGTYSRFFVTAPKIPDNVIYFADALKETVPEKLKIALEAQVLLEKLRKKRIKMVFEIVPEEKQWFYLLLEQHFFSEYFVIGAWIRYWLNIWSNITKNYTAPIYFQSKFSDIDIQKAKEFPIENLYKEQLRKSGKRFVGLCPFHEERTPSFFIFENNNWYCFGACSNGGDSINFLMKQENIGFVEAVRRLNGHY